MTSQRASPNDYILSIVNDALSGLESTETPLSSIIRKCIRIARLRNDYINEWWLEWEMINIGDNNLNTEIIKRVKSHFTRAELGMHVAKFIKLWENERKCAMIQDNLELEFDKKIIPKGVGEIEIEIRKVKKTSAESFPPHGLHTLDLYFISKQKDQIRTTLDVLASSYEAVLERIRERTHGFLSETEKQLLFGQINADIFEDNRKYVDEKLGKLNPEAISKFVSVYKRMQEKDPESYAQAAASCRRILKSLADALYPPSDMPIKCIDGRERILSDDKYLNRLYQYVYDQTAHSSSSELLLADIQLLGNKITKLYDLTCKGTHAEISEFEINQCVIHTYLMVGDILRISENRSAITLEIPIPQLQNGGSNCRETNSAN